MTAITRITSLPGRKTAPIIERAEPQLAEPVVIAHFWKNRRREAIRVALENYNGRNLVDVRQCYLGPDGKLQLSKKGIALCVRQLPELAAALNTAVERARELGLLDAEGVR